KSALAYLLHPAEALDAKETGETMKNHFGRLTDREICSRVQALVKDSGRVVELAELPQVTGDLYQPPMLENFGLSCRTMRRTVSADWGVSSFSSIVSGSTKTPEPDRDAVWVTTERFDAARLEASKPRTFFEFPRG